MKIPKFINGVIKYDNYGQYLWIIEPNGNHKKIADIRGFGEIQNMHKNKNGEIDIDSAIKDQDILGYWLAESLNEKIKNEIDV